MQLENAISEVFSLAGIENKALVPAVARVFRATGVREEVPPHVMQKIRGAAEQLKELGVK